jgi:hypothetical protein
MALTSRFPVNTSTWKFDVIIGNPPYQLDDIAVLVIHRFERQGIAPDVPGMLFRNGWPRRRFVFKCAGAHSSRRTATSMGPSNNVVLAN